MKARSSSSIVVVDDALVDPVGEPARVEAVLQRPARFVVEAHGRISSTVAARPSPRRRRRRRRRCAPGRASGPSGGPAIAADRSAREHEIDVPAAGMQTVCAGWTRVPGRDRPALLARAGREPARRLGRRVEQRRDRGAPRRRVRCRVDPDRRRPAGMRPAVAVEPACRPLRRDTAARPGARRSRRSPRSVPRRGRTASRSARRARTAGRRRSRRTVRWRSRDGGQCSGTACRCTSRRGRRRPGGRGCSRTRRPTTG